MIDYRGKKVKYLLLPYGIRLKGNTIEVFNREYKTMIVLKSKRSNKKLYDIMDNIRDNEAWIYKDDYSESYKIGCILNFLEEVKKYTALTK